MLQHVSAFSYSHHQVVFINKISKLHSWSISNLTRLDIDQLCNYEWKPMAIRSLGRPQTRWENDVKNDLNAMKIYNWKDCIQD